MSVSRDNAGGGGPSTRALTIFPVATGEPNGAMASSHANAFQANPAQAAPANPAPQPEVAPRPASQVHAQPSPPPVERPTGAMGWVISHVRRSRAAKAALLLGVLFVVAFVVLWNVTADDIQRLGLMIIAGFSVLAVGGLYLAYRTLSFARRLVAENVELRQSLQDTAGKLAGVEQEMRAASARQSTVLSVVAARVERSTAQRIAEIAELAQEVTLESSDAISHLEGRLLATEQALTRKADTAGLQDVKTGLARLTQTVETNAKDTGQKVAQVNAGLAAGAAAHDALRAAIVEQAQQSGTLIDEFERALSTKVDREDDLKLKAAVDEVAGLARELAISMQADAKALADMRVQLVGNIGAMNTQIVKVQAAQQTAYQAAQAAQKAAQAAQARQAEDVRRQVAAADGRISEMAARLEAKLNEFAARLGAKAEHHAIALVGSQVSEMTVLTEQAVRQAFVEIDLLKQKAPPEGLSAREIAIIKSRTIASENALKELGAKFAAIEATLDVKAAH